MDLRVGRLFELSLNVRRKRDPGPAGESSEKRPPTPITRPDAAALMKGDSAETIGAAAIAVSDMMFSFGDNWNSAAASTEPRLPLPK